MMMSELEYLDSDCEMTVLPQPKAPGMAVVPPCTQLREGNEHEAGEGRKKEKKRIERKKERKKENKQKKKNKTKKRENQIT